MAFPGGWHIWIDRGGTFTDFVALDPDGKLHTLKMLSVSTGQYDDAALPGIRRLLGLADGAAIDPSTIAEVRIGSTIGTNHLLERKGERVVLFVTEGFADLLRIGYQNRPDIFALVIDLPAPLHEDCFEIIERIDAQGDVRKPLDEAAARQAIAGAVAAGFQHGAVLFLHAYKNPAHELRFAELARDSGLQLTLSHQASPLIKAVRRGDTATVDAYLTPSLQRYARRFAEALPETRTLFLQSHGGLIEAPQFRGRDSLLSGPAGGVCGGAMLAKMHAQLPAIGFDMGGTSTDVWRFEAQFERTTEMDVGGVRLQRPSLLIHTVAAGGGSIVAFDGERLLVGPHSAGADPGPACYGRGGPPTITDANLILGRLSAAHLPARFGADGRQRLDPEAARRAFSALADAIARRGKESPSVEALADGALRLASEQMAAAVRRISLQRGFDPRQHALISFGGAGGQHCCALAESLGIDRILCSPLAGALSALGAGLATESQIIEFSIESALDESTVARTLELLASHPPPSAQRQRCRVYLRYAGAELSLPVAWGEASAMADAFREEHRRLFGFDHDQRAIEVHRLELERQLSEPPEHLQRPALRQANDSGKAGAAQPWRLYGRYGAEDAALYLRREIKTAQKICGPALVVSELDTIYLARDWQACSLADGTLRLQRSAPAKTIAVASAEADPIELELFGRRFQNLAEEMGVALQRSAVSVNIRERLDFSCALFDREGRLIANAPHIPVHLGSMADSVAALLRRRGDSLQAGDAYALNDPYEGGTHLPDITVIAPFFHKGALFAFLAARGHHADIGGRTPGSMPAQSADISEEGALLDCILLRRDGVLRTDEIVAALRQGPFPARNIDQNLGDLQAQLAACTRGAAILESLIGENSATLIERRMDETVAAARRLAEEALAKIGPGQARIEMDGDLVIALQCRFDDARRRMVFDFTGSSPQHSGNFNAPAPVVRAALMYAVRLACAREGPLNSGFLEALQIILPEDCFLNPRAPAAVAAGNVESSQAIVNAALLAMGLQANSQGTMNNLSFGTTEFQYYETICGGAGAGPGYPGASAVQTHMTNSRLTDPEILETRFPVIVERFSLRPGSGGRGQFKGGDGVVRRLRFLAPVSLSLLSNNRRNRPLGLAGGGDGKAGANWLLSADGKRRSLPATVELDVAAGEAIEIESPGGGAYGAADAADAAARLRR